MKILNKKTDCNNCDAQCPKKRYHNHISGDPCGGHFPSLPFKVPFLIKNVESQPQVIADLLAKLKLGIEEMKGYPFFRLFMFIN